MVFWIITAAIVLVLARYVYVFFSDEGPFAGLLMSLFATFIAGCLWALMVLGLVGVSALMGANQVTQETQNLKALGSDSSVEGRMYFLGVDSSGSFRGSDPYRMAMH